MCVYVYVYIYISPLTIRILKNRCWKIIGYNWVKTDVGNTWFIYALWPQLWAPQYLVSFMTQWLSCRGDLMPVYRGSQEIPWNYAPPTIHTYSLFDSLPFFLFYSDCASYLISLLSSPMFCITAPRFPRRHSPFSLCWDSNQNRIYWCPWIMFRLSVEAKAKCISLIQIQIETFGQRVRYINKYII